MSGKLRHLFPGGNTAYGFHSYYDHLIPADANKVFMLKGGPGVGKSSFMRRIGDELLKRGFDVEHHHCSSDPRSLDGMALQKEGIALLDGTAPHIVDPKYPGAVDEIIHLGDYWNELVILENRAAIITMTQEISRLFRRAYGYLRGAKVYQDEYISYYADANALDKGALNALARDLEQKFLPNEVHPHAPKERHLFASAITPDGEVNYLDSLFADCDSLVALEAMPGAGAEYVLDHLAGAIAVRGLKAELFHCALDPKRIEHILVPELELGITISREPHRYRGKVSVVEDLNSLVSQKRLALYRRDMERAQKDSAYALETAISFILRAKTLHDDLENFYVPHMDFSAVNECRDRTLARILNFAAR